MKTETNTPAQTLQTEVIYSQELNTAINGFDKYIHSSNKQIRIKFLAIIQAMITQNNDNNLNDLTINSIASHYKDLYKTYEIEAFKVSYTIFNSVAENKQLLPFINSLDMGLDGIKKSISLRKKYMYKYGVEALTEIEAKIAEHGYTAKKQEIIEAELNDLFIVEAPAKEDDEVVTSEDKTALNEANDMPTNNSQEATTETPAKPVTDDVSEPELVVSEEAKNALEEVVERLHNIQLIDLAKLSNDELEMFIKLTLKMTA